MERYLITIYVTTEEEQAISYLYQLKGWTFLKLGKASLFDTPPDKSEADKSGDKDQLTQPSFPKKNDDVDSESTLSAGSDAKRDIDSDFEEIQANAHDESAATSKSISTATQKALRKSVRNKKSNVDSCAEDNNKRSVRSKKSKLNSYAKNDSQRLARKKKCKVDNHTADKSQRLARNKKSKVDNSAEDDSQRSARNKKSKVDNSAEDDNQRSPVYPPIDDSKASCLEKSNLNKVMSKTDKETGSVRNRQKGPRAKNKKRVTHTKTVKETGNISDAVDLDFKVVEVPTSSDTENHEYGADIDIRLDSYPEENVVYAHVVERPQTEKRCDFCKVVLEEEEIIDRHQQISCQTLLQEAKTEEGYFCTTCCITVSTANAFIRHLLNGSCNSGMCPECGLVFNTLEMYQKHQNLVCGEKLKANETEAGYYCKGCRSTFKSSSSFIEHKIHRSCIGNVLKCEFCGKTYPTKRRHCFSMHIRKHLGDRQHMCPTCGKRYLRPETLRDHMRVHTGERPFKCNYCHLEFTTGAHRRNHEMLKHIEVPRSHICHKCGAAFKFRARLSHHLNIVHLDERNFPCQSCDKRFKSNTLLKEHMKIHFNKKDHICDVCGKSFITIKYLNSHMRRHTEGKTHICDDCGKAFFTRQHLLIHERVHTGAKPYKCILCEYRCTCRGNMCKHIKTVHGKANPGPFVKRLTPIEAGGTAIKAIKTVSVGEKQEY